MSLLLFLNFMDRTARYFTSLNMTIKKVRIKTDDALKESQHL